jgi:hypothetical protein
MRAKAIIILAVLVFLAILAFAWFRSEDEYQQKVDRGRAVAMGLNAQFLAEPRYRDVKALGYSTKGAPLWSQGFFQIAGSVSSTNDWLNVKNLVLALSPPGKLDNKVVIKRPAQPAQLIVKSPAPTNQPTSKVPARISPRKK